VNDIARAISQLERQRATIDRAIAALREVESLTPAATVTPGASRVGGKAVKRRMSAEGRKRISEAAKKRWAEKRDAESPAAKKGSVTKKMARRKSATKAASSSVPA
jgi:hypothetical protein